MIKKRIAVTIILTIISIFVFASCNSVSTVYVGNYYLDGNKDNAYIQIINENKLKFVNFDVKDLTNYLVGEAGHTGKDAEDFMERQNLPDVFYGEIEFEFDKNANAIYVKALSNTDYDPWVVNYRMTYADKNTILFMEKTYICS